MPTISLHPISNHRSGTPSHRMLAFTLREYSAEWSQLIVTIPVQYTFLGSPEQWSPGRKRTFREEFEIRGAAAWTRQYLLVKRGIFSDHRVEVVVRIVENPGAPVNELWHVVAVPSGWGAATHVDYSFTGRFSAQVLGANVPTNDTIYERVACVVLSESDNSCNTLHLGDHRTRVRRLPAQRGTDHEIGHMLGMQHPRRPSNEESAYGDPDDPNEGGRVMGLGSRVTPLDYHWAKQLMHVRTCDTWSVVSDDRTPRRAGCREPDAWHRR